jgi:alanyl-tRNA synthetase
MDANALRRAWMRFFTERGHVERPSASLIPTHPTAPMFTNSGMMQFVPYFLGEEQAPWPRVATVQKCVRAGGKHNDLDAIGRSRRHLSFFEMLGNFSFGDYFKAEAIPWAWEFVTEVLGLDPDRIWVTVHVSDDEAAEIWHEAVGFPIERIQRFDKDNFWEMGDTGPCGPSSEIFWDYGPALGEGGGPAHGSEERYVEIWNLVFTQYFRQPDGGLVELPSKNVDTGAGLERILAVLAGSPSLYDADVLAAMVDAAEAVTGTRMGASERGDIALRILADHGRTMTFLVNDGVFPSNEDRGYVLRRIIRRAVRYAYLLGVEKPVTPALVARCVEVMGEAYPDLRQNEDFVSGVIVREEERFRQTLKTGSALLDQELDALGEGRVLPGSVAFFLHDTYGFPLEVTREVAAERGVAVDEEGFRAAMEEQRRRAREARREAQVDDEAIATYREVLDQFGPTEFTGYRTYESVGRVLAVLNGGTELFLDRTPFYAEAGGQVGDTGWIVTETGRARVVDTTWALPGLIRHHVEITEGTITPGQEATATVDAERREAIRRNHTGTHLLHWALREVLGSHVKQAGSLVAPDRLRFDFNHFEAPTPEQLAEVERLVNERILADEPVRAYETSLEEAQRMGAIMFFGEKYGDVVRVVEAGERSTELCGGTHVAALGMIGPFKIVSEGSIGANTRRIEAVTGFGALERFRREEEILARAAELLKVRPDEVAERVERELEARRELEAELRELRRQVAGAEAAALAAQASDGLVVARRDGRSAAELRELALAVRERPGVRAVVLGGAAPGGGAALVAAVAPGSGLHAGELLAEAARAVGGGSGRQPDVAVAGGKDAGRIDEALELARAAALAAAR